ncbi:predicted protein, partial [Nematostella vectensis]
MTNNVVDLMLSNIQKLPEQCHRALQIAACIGSPFNLSLLASVSNTPIRAMQTHLLSAVSEGLLIPLDSHYDSRSGLRFERTRYRFVHDRVQQAAYMQIPETQRNQLHLQIGRLLKQQPNTPWFDITNHLNTAHMLITDEEERLALAQLNALSGQQALEAAAFEAANRYFDMGIDLLPTAHWRTHYPLSLRLFTQGAEAAYLSGQYARMESLITAVITHAQQLLDTVRVYEVRIQSHVARNQFEQAVQSAIHILAQLGVTLPATPGNVQIWHSYLNTQWLLRKYPAHMLTERPSAQKPEHLAALSILASMFGAVKFSSSRLRPLVMAKEVELTLRYGLAPHSSMALAGYGGVLCSQYRAIEQGYALGKQAVLLDQTQPESL